MRWRINHFICRDTFHINSVPGVILHMSNLSLFDLFDLLFEFMVARYRRDRCWFNFALGAQPE